MSEVAALLALRIVAHNLTGPGLAGVSAGLAKQTAEARKAAAEQTSAIRQQAAAQTATIREQLDRQLLAERQARDRSVLATRAAGEQQIAALRASAAGQSLLVQHAAARQVVAVRDSVAQQTLAIRQATDQQVLAMREGADRQIVQIDRVRDAQVLAAREAADAQVGQARGHAGGLHGALNLALDAALAAPIVLGAVKAPVQAALGFQQQVAATAANTTMTPADVALMQQTVQRVSGQTGAPIDQLLGAFRHAVNFGFSAREAAQMLPAATASALATGAPVDSTMNTLANVMHEYGAGAGQAMPFMDLLHMGAAQSNSTLEEFSKVGARSIDMAANLGISAPQAIAALASLSRHESLEDANTQIVGMLSKIVNPAGKERKTLAALSLRSGIDLLDDFTPAGVKKKGISGVMADLRAATGGNVAEMFQAIPALRGGVGAMLLTGTARGDNAHILGSLRDVQAGKSKPTETTFSAYLKTTAAQLKIAEANFKLLEIAIGTKLLPVVTRLAVVLSGVLGGALAAVAHPTAAWSAALRILGTVAGSMMAALRAVGGTTLQIASAVTQLLAPLGLAHGAFKGAQAGAAGLGTALGLLVPVVAGYLGVSRAIRAATALWSMAQAALNLVMSANPIALVVIAIAALVVGVVYAWNHWRGFHDFIVKAWQFLQSSLGPTLQALAGFLGGAFKAAWDLVSGAVQAYWRYLRIVWAFVSEVFGPALKTLGDWLGGVFADYWQTVTDKVQLFWQMGQALYSWLPTLAGGLKDILGGALDWVKQRIHDLAGVLGGFMGMLSKLPGMGALRAAVHHAVASVDAQDQAAHPGRKKTPPRGGATAPDPANPLTMAMAVGNGGPNAPHAIAPRVQHPPHHPAATHQPKHPALTPQQRAAANRVLHPGASGSGRPPEQAAILDFGTAMTRFRRRKDADPTDVARMVSDLATLGALDPAKAANLQAQLDTAVNHRNDAIARAAATATHHTQAQAQRTATRNASVDAAVLLASIRNEIREHRFSQAARDIARYRTLDATALHAGGLDWTRAHNKANATAQSLVDDLGRAQTAAGHKRGRGQVTDPVQRDILQFTNDLAKAGTTSADYTRLQRELNGIKWEEHKLGYDNLLITKDWNRYFGDFTKHFKGTPFAAAHVAAARGLAQSAYGLYPRVVPGQAAGFGTSTIAFGGADDGQRALVRILEHQLSEARAQRDELRRNVQVLEAQLVVQAQSRDQLMTIGSRIGRPGPPQPANPVQQFGLSGFVR